MEMEHENRLNCCVCAHEYSDSIVPRNLRCGHSVCSNCLNRLIFNSAKRCPECRNSFTEDSADQFPINYPILRLSRMIALGKNVKSASPEWNVKSASPEWNVKSASPEWNVKSASPEWTFPICQTYSEYQQDAGFCPTHGCPMFFMCIRCSVWICRECWATNHPDYPRGGCFVLPVKEAMIKIKESHTASATKYVEDSNALRVELEHDWNIITVAKRYVNSGNFELLGEINKQTQLGLIRLGNLTEFMKEAKERLNNTSSPEKILGMMRESSDCQRAFGQYITNEKAKETPNILNTILASKKDLTELLNDGMPVNVVTEENGKVGWAPLFSLDGRVLFYPMSDGKPPEESINIPHMLLRDLASGL